MKTHVIILAQGTQQRLTGVQRPKQLLPLPACRETSILNRTLIQVWKLLGGVGINDPGVGYNDHRVTVVTWEAVRRVLEAYPCTTSISPVGGPMQFVPECQQLSDPGNSSLKGISRYLAEASLPRGLRNDTWPERTVVLLGDVVYSWRCLEAIFTSDVPLSRSVRFVGTSDLSTGGGELWGLTWTLANDALLMRALEIALGKHPNFPGTYQPGQLRRWLWAVDGLVLGVFTEANRGDWYTAIDDYTMDVDLPEHIACLGPASELAAADDREHGVTW